MNKMQRYFFDPDCNKIEFEDAYVHDEIAKKIIECDQKLKEEYAEIRKSGVVSESVFLVMKGYVYVGGRSETHMGTMYSSISLNDNTKSLMGELKSDGYFAYDIIRNELSKDQMKQIVDWAKSGMKKEEIRTRVMTEMLVLLAPTKNESKEVKKVEER